MACDSVGVGECQELKSGVWVACITGWGFSGVGWGVGRADEIRGREVW